MGLPSGQLKVAEVTSRFVDLDKFVDFIKLIGFSTPTQVIHLSSDKFIDSISLITNALVCMYRTNQIHISSCSTSRKPCEAIQPNSR